MAAFAERGPPASARPSRLTCLTSSTACDTAEAFDDRRVGHAARLAHCLQAVAAAGLLEMIDERRHEAGPEAPSG